MRQNGLEAIRLPEWPLKELNPKLLTPTNLIVQVALPAAASPYFPDVQPSAMRPQILQ